MSKVSIESNVATLVDGSTIQLDPQVIDQTTGTRATAVALRDAGRTNAEIGALMGTTDGSAGNNVTNGLRDMGRGDEIQTNGTGARSRSAATASPVEVAEQSLERAREARANLGDAVKKADVERKAFVADIKRLGLDTTERDDRTPIEALCAREHDRLDGKVRNARESVKARQVELDQTIGQWEGALNMLKDMK